MAKTALDLTPAEWRRYKPSGALERRAKEEVGESGSRKERALDVARKAAELLHREFGARKVAVFGSLVHERNFSAWSDIDIAAWGIPPDRFYAAVGAVTGLSPLFKVDLVDVDECKPALREAIEKEGMLL